MQTRAATEGYPAADNKAKKPRRTAPPDPVPDMPLISSPADDAAAPFSTDVVVQHPLPGYSAPVGVSFSPDDRRVAFLYSTDNSLHRSVFCVDVGDAGCGRNNQHVNPELIFSPPGGGLEESNLSVEEKLRRERARERGLGVAQYQWRPAQQSDGSDKAGIVVPLPSGVYFQDLCGSEPELKLKSSPTSPIVEPHLSPDGSMIAFVRDDELYVSDLCGEIKQLTFGAKETGKSHGVAEFIAQEEMERKLGFWWSPDSKYIAFTEVDSSMVPLYRIIHQGKSSFGSDAQEDHAYPFAGKSNVRVRLGVVSSTGGTVTWMDLCCGVPDIGEGEEEYLARVNWMLDNSLTAQVLNRLHTKLQLLKFDIITGRREVLLVEEHHIWLTLHDCFTPLDKNVSTSSFIWASEKTGFRHLYVYDKMGTCLGPLTEGDWMVEHIVGINENAGLVYFTGTFDGPLETNLYCTKLSPTPELPLPAPKRLSLGSGRHTVVLDHQFLRFIDIYDSLKHPPKVLLCSLQDGSVIMPLYEQPLADLRLRKLQNLNPEIFEVSAKDGTVLYGALYLPDEKVFGPPPYKTLVNVYGGPTVHLVYDSWINTVDMRAQYLRSKGILVWKLDNRGTARRGLHFESHMKHQFGQVDADDQVTGVEWLIKQGLAKTGHIGIYGWSYGGFLSAMCLARFPELFSCAVAGAPVTSWEGYDTFYTEKYMGLPAENPEEYKRSSVMHHVPNIKGKLLLVHGLIDENVHFSHTARLINALIAANKPYELLLFPNERHMPRHLSDRVYLENRVCDFIDRSL